MAPSVDYQESLKFEVSPKLPRAKHELPPCEYPWANQPWPLFVTPATQVRITNNSLHIANEICQAQNAMLRGLNSLYLQAGGIVGPDAAAAAIAHDNSRQYVHWPVVRRHAACQSLSSISEIDDESSDSQSADNTLVTDFCFLAASWAGWVLQHQENLARILFPGIEKVLEDSGSLLPGLLHEQMLFVPHLQALMAYADRVVAHASTAAANYNSSQMRTLLAAIGDPLRVHMGRLVATIACLDESSAYRRRCGGCIGGPAARHDDADSRKAAAMYLHIESTLMKTWQNCEAELRRATCEHVVPPMLVRLRDVTFGALAEGCYPSGGVQQQERPWPGLSVLAVHTVEEQLSQRYAGSWRFLPCNVWGRPQRLPFVDEEWETARGGMDGSHGDEVEGWALPYTP